MKSCVMMAVRNRYVHTLRTINSLLNDGETHGIVIYDVGSDEERDRLSELYNHIATNNNVRIVYLAPPKNDWGKSLALNHFKKMITEYPIEYVAIVDNDVLLLPGWLTTSINILEESDRSHPNVKIVSPFRCPCQRVYLHKADIAGRNVAIKRKHGSACLVLRASDFVSLPDFPPNRADDAFLWEQALNRNWVFAEMTDPLALDISVGISERLKRGFRW